MADLYQAPVVGGVVQPYVPEGMVYTPTPMPQLPMATIAPSIPTLNIQGEGGYPSFSFNFNQEQQQSYNDLKPYYTQLLQFSNGNLDLAKRMLEYTYQTGMRTSKADYNQQKSQQEIDFPKEQEALTTDQNQRGILTSGFGKQDQSRLTQSQALRREAIDRALQERQTQLTSERGFGLEQKQQENQQQQFDLEKQRRDEASQMAEKKFGIAQTGYQAQLQQAMREEQRRTQSAATSAGSGAFGPSSGKTFEQFMAESGRQSELDAANKNGTASQLRAQYGY